MMQFYAVKIVDAIRHAGELEHHLVEYQVQASTGALARMRALEHHLARPDREGRAVRWAQVEPKPVDERVVAIAEIPITVDELEQLERRTRPYIVASNES